MTTLESVLVHITGSDVPGPKPCECGRPVKAVMTSVNIGTMKTGEARLLLGQATSRKRALLVTDTVPSKIVLSTSESDARSGVGARLYLGTSAYELHATNEIWVGVVQDGGGTDAYVSAIAEYKD